MRLPRRISNTMRVNIGMLVVVGALFAGAPHVPGPEPASVSSPPIACHSPAVAAASQAQAGAAENAAVLLAACP